MTVQTPRTLLQMAGVNAAAPAVDDCVLLLIDMQREYVDGGLPLTGVDAALAEAERLLTWARGEGAPVVHIRHRGPPGGLFDPAAPNFALHESVAPLEGELVIDKVKPNAFADTDLAERLRETGRPTLVVAGFMTHMCVSSTVRSALDHGLQCVVVSGACATRDLPDVNGGTLAASALQAAELAGLADRFATVLPDAKAVA